MALSYDERLGLRQAIDRATRAKWNPYSNGAAARHLVSAAEREGREQADADLVLDVLIMFGTATTKQVWRSSGLPKWRVIAALRKLELAGRIRRAKSMVRGEGSHATPWEVIG